MITIANWLVHLLVFSLSLLCLIVAAFFIYMLVSTIKERWEWR